MTGEIPTWYGRYLYAVISLLLLLQFLLLVVVLFLYSDGLGLGGPGPILGNGSSSHIHSVQTDSEFHTTIYLMNIRGSSPEGKAAGE
jgi:hypothetical protein